jgi:hypothetical protein
MPLPEPEAPYLDVTAASLSPVPGRTPRASAPGTGTPARDRMDGTVLS